MRMEVFLEKSLYYAFLLFGDLDVLWRAGLKRACQTAPELLVNSQSWVVDGWDGCFCGRATPKNTMKSCWFQPFVIVYSWQYAESKWHSLVFMFVFGPSLPRSFQHQNRLHLVGLQLKKDQPISDIEDMESVMGAKTLFNSQVTWD